jgi:hypothetical protein
LAPFSRIPHWNYIAIVRGTGNTSGIAVVEAYSLSQASRITLDFRSRAAE